MYIVYWNIALHGMHLFRTGEYNQSDADNMRIELALLQKFPAAEGYEVTRNWRENRSWSKTVNEQ